MLVTNPLPQPRPRGPPREKLPATKDPGTGCENLQESCRFCSLENMGTPPLGTRLPQAHASTMGGELVLRMMSF